MKITRNSLETNVGPSDWLTEGMGPWGRQVSDEEYATDS